MDNKMILRFGLIAIAGIILVFLVKSYSKSNRIVEEEVSGESGVEEFNNGESEELVQPGEALGNNSDYEAVDSEDVNNTKDNQYPKDCFPKDQLNPEDLLPTDDSSKWAQVNPKAPGELGDQNFLEAGHHIGVNTVGQTLRNANMQIRSEPPNPQMKVSPWLQTTIEPDSNRKPMEIGGC